MLLFGTHNRKSALTARLPLLKCLGAVSLFAVVLAGCTDSGTPTPTATRTPTLLEASASAQPPTQEIVASATAQETVASTTEQPPTQAAETAATEPPPTQAAAAATEPLSTAAPEATSDANTTPSPNSSPVTRNADWTPIERDFNDVTMVLVPAGCFQMGRDGVSSSEAPEHEQCFEESFWIDKTEVTNRQFARLNGEAELPSANRSANAPRETISELEAAAFCALRGARLSTEREWEYAASGPDNLIYPWGNEWVEDNAVWEGNSKSRTAATGSRPQNASWVGALDLSGNVWEWTSSIDSAYPYDPVDGRESADNIGGGRIIRGGSWANQPQSLTTSFRLRNIPTVRDDKIGFRCAQDN